MKALILNGLVYQVEAEEFEVHSDFIWVDCDNTVGPGHTYDGTSFSPPAQVSAEAQLEKLRSKRDMYLAASDWTQNSDSPLSDADKTAWATYRQSLRDITNTYQSMSDDGFAWPTKPGS